jgi:predicted MFS family arabinose efflux permease
LLGSSIGKEKTSEKPVIVGLIGQTVWSAGPGAFWAFAERIAANNGISTASIETALSIGLLAGLAGAAAPALQGRRWGQMKPIVLATFLIVLSSVAYQFSGDAVVITVAISVFYATWNYSVVYQMGFVSELDYRGRFAAVIPATQVLGYSIGAFFVGFLVTEIGSTGVLVSFIISASVGAALYMVSYRSQKASQINSETFKGTPELS